MPDINIVKKINHLLWFQNKKVAEFSKSEYGENNFKEKFMKYIFVFSILFSCTSSLPLLHCFRKVSEKHHKLKDQPPIVDAFLTEGMNKPQPITLSLHNPELNSIITRSIPHYLFKKSAEWELEIITDQNDSVDINDLLISSPHESHKNSLHLYTWDLKPKRCGMALLRATYKAPYRKDNPHVQEFIVTVE